MIANAFQTLYTVSLIILGIGILFAMIRAIKGPRIADRIVAINMIGTMTMLSIAILAMALDQSYLLDVCLIYVMISFLAVVVLSKIYITVYLDKKQKQNAHSANVTAATAADSANEGSAAENPKGGN